MNICYERLVLPVSLAVSGPSQILSSWHAVSRPIPKSGKPESSSEDWSRTDARDDEMYCASKAVRWAAEKDKTKDADDGGADLADWLALGVYGEKGRDCYLPWICSCYYHCHAVFALCLLSAPRFTKDSEIHVGSRYSMTAAVRRCVLYEEDFRCDEAERTGGRSKARRHMRGERDRLFCTALMYMWYVVHVLMYICTVYRRVIGWT